MSEGLTAAAADFSTAQLTDETAALRLVAQRGFSDRFLNFFDVVKRDEAGCGTALTRHPES